ncbi:Alanine--tRNA ligase [Candidatus Annandia adelgestsuga]|uniref:Alanine--tRNA ligase n=1 Tax=Candidatus Annandia adelgestsuga TaxID=1302411 RepID=A0A3Q9CL99_9ENTR|nr:alanine--tRNA ligase [Candidatus Annandia adelgestsuga]AZP36148.1 Alanine--tRNA ligase [Candidatus Annandia adelgestsuga]
MKKSMHEIRKIFINFFINKNHVFIKSSSLIPYNDPTLLFTNAGMNQFKEIFLGNYKNFNFKKVVTSQRCIRVGGRHNDLNNIGNDEYHNTFFEMLGNFSFGSYFKKESILYAWELLTNKNLFNLNPDKLLVTVYYKDVQSYNIWIKNIGISKKNILKIYDNKKLNISSNFWQMGDTGPCGPCTEIYYNYKNENNISLINNEYLKKNCLEIWNIVFIQFNKLSNGKLLKLDKPLVDTGMGLERITSVLQNVKSNYKTNIFKLIIQEIKNLFIKLTLNKKFLYIISDHIRSCIFLIYDGILPSNEGRGYILRHIIRRCIQQGYIIKYYKPFLYKLVIPVINVIKLLHPYLIKKNIYIKKIIKKEEKKFIKTLGYGLKILNKKLKNINNKKLDGKIAFNLYDTFGFPLDLTLNICNNLGISIDNKEYEKQMLKQKKKSRNNKFKLKYSNNIIPSSIFIGYYKNKCKTKINYIIVNNKFKKKICNGEKCIIFLDKTPFYAESGGQIGDSGYLKNKNFFFEVQDTQKYSKSIGHIGILKVGTIIINDNCIANINIKRRHNICINHSSTHLLKKSLKKILNSNIKQKGSLIKENYFNFDFNYKKNISDKDLYNIELLLNNYIKKKINVNIYYKKKKFIKFKKKLFIYNYKNNNNIRLINIENIFQEFCCGTHIKNTKEIGIFIIKSKIKKSKNIYRIKAITEKYAINYIIKKKNNMNKILKKLKIDDNKLDSKIKLILKNNKKYKKKIKEIQKLNIKNEINLIKYKSKNINNYKIIISKVDINYKFYKRIINYIKNKLNYTIIFLIFNNKNNYFLIIYVNECIKEKINSKIILNKFYEEYKNIFLKNKNFVNKDGIFLKKNNLNLNKIKNFILKKII